MMQVEAAVLRGYPVHIMDILMNGHTPLFWAYDGTPGRSQGGRRQICITETRRQLAYHVVLYHSFLFAGGVVDAIHGYLRTVA